MLTAVAVAGCGDTSRTATFSGALTGTVGIELGDYDAVEFPEPVWGLAITTDAGVYPELNFGIEVAGVLQAGNFTGDNSLFVDSSVAPAQYGPYWSQALISGDLAGDEGSFGLTITSAGTRWSGVHGMLTLVLVPDGPFNHSAANVTVDVNF
jgi:hypothetical protein